MAHVVDPQPIVKSIAIGASVRDYLYLWHQPAAKRIVASGIEFRDFVPDLAPAGGVVLLRHNFSQASFDPASRFAFVPAGRIAESAADDIYRYGDFCWADFGRHVALADLADPAVAALMFFAHAARPLGGAVEVPGLGNRLLCWAHDDGWYARVFYSRWDAVGPLIGRSLARVLDAERAAQTCERVRRGDGAFWCHAGTAVDCEQTENIDALQQKHVTGRRSRPAGRGGSTRRSK